MGKVVFLDIDGTLIDFQQHMNEGTWFALQRARKNGHKIVLCTDRTYTGIYPWLLKMPVDGTIASSGAYVRCGDEVVTHHMLDPDPVRVLNRKLWQQGAVTFTQGIHAGYAMADHKERILDYFRRRGMDGDKFLNGITVVKDPSGKAALEKVLYFAGQGAFRMVLKEILAELDDYFYVAGTSFSDDLDDSGMICRNGITKASGMAELLAYWNFSRKDCIAIGDGADDFDMIRYAAVGIAMENGIPELKDLADYTTTSIEQGGIVSAFKDFGLI